MDIAPIIASLPHAPSADVVPGAPDAPVVWLLDEYHQHEASIGQNIDIALALLAQDAAGLVGVEDYYAEDDLYDGGEAYVEPHPPSDLPQAASADEPSRFAMAVYAVGHAVIGVDSEAWVNQFLGEPGGGPVGDHPAQWGRSMHFLRSLLSQYAARNASGNVILNCGSNHNTHLVLVARAAVKPAWWPDLTLVRLRAPAYPADEKAGGRA